jgi:hypothetical protein
MDDRTVQALNTLLSLYDLPLPDVVEGQLPRSGGIYFLEAANTIEYIGQASLLNLRLASHAIYQPELHTVYFLEIKNQYLRSSVEAALIGILKPNKNTALNPNKYNEKDPNKDTIEPKSYTLTELSNDLLIKEIGESKGSLLAELGDLLIKGMIEQLKIDGKLPREDREKPFNGQGSEPL